MDGADIIDPGSKGKVVDFLFHRQRAAAAATGEVDWRRRAASYRALLEDTAELIEMVIGPMAQAKVGAGDLLEEDREALKAQGESIRELLREPGR